MTPKEAIKYLLDKVPEDEPIFIVRGRDALGARTIEYWCREAEWNGVPEGKIELANVVKEAMEHYQVKRLPD